MKPNVLLIPLATATLLVFGTAHASPADEAIENVESTAVEAATVEATSPAEEAAERFSDGMRIPVDGSSLEAFEKSLERIEKKTRKAEFTTLNNAIDYLLVYDLAAKRNRAKLAANLDGLTGEEIVAKVEWRKGKKYETPRR